jgi:integrase
MESTKVIYSVTDGLASKHTKKKYRIYFNNFVKYQRLTDEAELIDKPAKELENIIIAYITRHLATTLKLRRGSIHTQVYAIFHFFDMNDIQLNTKKIMRFLPPDDEGNREDRAYTVEEIQALLSKCDERFKVVILLMASTGMRIGALSSLNVGDLTKIPEYNLYKIMVYAGSRKDRYYTFCTPECASAIDSYLQYRERLGEGESLKPGAPLIREQFNIYDLIRIKSPQRLTVYTFEWMIRQLLIRSGMEPGKVKQSHGFRKFAITQMIKAKVDYSSREYLVGHKYSRGLDASYDRTTEEDRLSEYLKAVDYLTIHSENRLKDKIQKLESEKSEELKLLKRQVAEMREVLLSIKGLG